jgi:hypothetical protein
MRPVVFSASSVNSYLDCHLQWYFGYVMAAEAVESEPQRVGIQVHAYAEERLRHIDDQYRVADTSPRPEVKALLRVFDNDILPTYRDPVLIEAEFQITVNDIPYSGILDAVDRQDVGPGAYANILRDTKTTGSRPSPGKHHFAMTGYWLGATDLGFEPDTAQLDWLVRTKNPYYWPEVIGPLDDDDIALFVRTLEEVAESVERGDFEPTGLGTWKCKACPYATICGPYSRYKELIDA